MPKSVKYILYAISGLVVLFIFIAAALLHFADINSYKPRLEAAASEALGMEVKVDGRMGVGFYPSLSFTLEDAHIRNRGADVISAKQARLEIDLLPLLHKQVRIAKIVLKHSIVSIERDSNGKFNFDNSEGDGGKLPALDLPKISLADAVISYADKQSGEGFNAGGCSLDLRHLRLEAVKRTELMKHLSFAAELACGELRTKDYAVSKLKFSLAGKGGVFDVDPVTMEFLGGQGSGNIRADYSGAVPLYQVRYSLAQFRVEEFLKTLSPQTVAEGPMDFSANLAMQGKTVNEIEQTASGDISLRGEHLMFNGGDLDREFARFESSQHFNLVDAGAFFFAGPVGLAVTKGYNFASIFKGSDGHSDIRKLVSDWKVEQGVAHAQDVAMATNENRVALAGGLDFVNEQFDDVTMALIDAQGCAMVRQRIRGTFRKPVVERPNILKTLTGPALSLLKKGRGLLPGGKCDVFYAGSVAPRR